jgi:hypothetical protein
MSGFSTFGAITTAAAGEVRGLVRYQLPENPGRAEILPKSSMDPFEGLAVGNV